MRNKNCFTFFRNKTNKLFGYTKNYNGQNHDKRTHAITFSQIATKILEFLRNSLLVPEIQHTGTVAPLLLWQHFQKHLLLYTCLNTYKSLF